MPKHCQAYLNSFNKLKLISYNNINTKNKPLKMKPLQIHSEF